MTRTMRTDSRQRLCFLKFSFMCLGVKPMQNFSGAFTWFKKQAFTFTQTHSRTPSVRKSRFELKVKDGFYHSYFPPLLPLTRFFSRLIITKDIPHLNQWCTDVKFCCSRTLRCLFASVLYTDLKLHVLSQKHVINTIF